MTNVQDLLARQAKWQKSLRDLPWPEKIRMAAKLRESIKKLRDVDGPPELSSTKDGSSNEREQG